MRKFKPWGKDGYIVTCNIKELTNIRGGSRNFKTGGRGPGAVEFLGLGFVLMPLHIYPIYVFVVRIMNNIHIVNIVC